MSLDGCGDVAQQGLYVMFDRVLPLLIRCRALMCALVGLVEGGGLVGAEGGVVVAA